MTTWRPERRRDRPALVAKGAADVPAQAVVERLDVHRGEAPGVGDGVLAEEGHVVHATQHHPIRSPGDQRWLGPKVAGGVPWQCLYAG